MFFSKVNRMIKYDIISLVIIIVSIIAIFFGFQPEKMVYFDEGINVENEWVTPDGEVLALKDMPVGDVRITHNLVGLDLNDRRLCFKSCDTHIKQAASIITKSFDKIGKCFRTGGDEFVVIAKDCSDDAVKTAINDMEQMENKYNTNNKPPVPLEISYGFARFIRKTGSLEAAEKLADERMYAKKKAMKMG